MTETKTFDEDTMDNLQEAVKAQIAKHPEIRDIVVIVDYQNKMNQSNIRSAFWMGDAEGNPPRKIDAMVGGISQVNWMLERMYLHLVQASQGLARDVEDKAKALLDLEETCSEFQKKLTEAKTEYAAITSRSGGTVRRGSQNSNEEAEEKKEES